MFHLKCNTKNPVTFNIDRTHVKPVPIIQYSMALDASVVPCLHIQRVSNEVDSFFSPRGPKVVKLLQIVWMKVVVIYLF